MHVAVSPKSPTTDDLLRLVAQSTAAATGQDFFHALTCALASSLHACNVSLSQPTPSDPNRIETLSQFADGRHQPNLIYAIDGTPCKNVLGKSYVHFPENVARIFPLDTFLAETRTQSYIGVPLSTPDNRSLGLLTLCHDHPTHHLSHLKHVLALFAARAAAELTRLKTEQSLRDAHASLDRRVRERTAELSAVTSRIPCILWRAALHGPPDWRRDPSVLTDPARWDFKIVDTDAAQRLLPLNLRDGAPYAIAWGRTVHPDDHRTIIDTTARALAEGRTSFDRDFRCTDRDGQLHWLHEEVVVDPAGDDRWSLFGVVTDVTDRRLAEDALRASEERYALATGAGRVGIWEHDYVHDRLYISPQLAAMHGRPPSHFTDIVHWRAQAHPDDRRRVDAVRNDPTATSYELEVRRLHADGSYRWFLSRGTIARDPSTGRPLHMTGTLTDITDLKHAEAALRASEQNYRQVADSNKRLLLELDHRLRNQLAGLVSLVSLMADRSTSVKDFASAIDARLRAMSHVHELLSETRWQNLDLQTLLSSLLAQSRPLTPHPTDVRLSGPAVSIPATSALPLSLILTEFLSNSIKYGAHSAPGGQVSLDWSVDTKASSSVPLLNFQWIESGGPPVPPDPSPSLGTSLIRSFARRELAGDCCLSYPSTGAAHTLTFPLRIPPPGYFLAK